jgi:capsular exopolysaccharide synthesis family protein
LEAPVFDPASAGASSLDVMHYVRAFWRRKWVLLGVALVVAAGVALYTLRQPRRYAASASLIIDVTAPRVLDSDVKEVMGEERSNYWFNKEYTETQKIIITSRAVSARVVDKLGLQHDAAFLGVAHLQDEKERLKAMEGLDAADLLRSRISVSPVKDSRLMNISVQDLDPQRAALLANEVADAYMSENLALKLRMTDTATQWLEERRLELEKTSNASELAVHSFKMDADLLSTSMEDPESIIKSRIDGYSNKLTEVRTKVAGLKARVESIQQLRKQAKPDDMAWAEALPGANEPHIQTLKTRWVEQRAVCAELAERYLEEHPKMLECQRKLAVVREDYARSLDNLVRAAETELAQASAEERNLAKLLDETKAEGFEVQKRLIQLDRLRRESDNNRRLYELVLKRLKDIELSGLLRTSNVRVLDSARPSYVPVSPNVRKNLALGLVAGLLLGALAVLALEFAENTVSSQLDVEDRLKLPFLGFVPRIEDDGKGKDLVFHRMPRSSVAECWRAIRTNLLFMSPDKPFKTMLVTSSGPQEGKSTTCINLGVAMAQSGNRVLLLDTDMRRPRLHKAFGVSNEVGISSLVVGEGSLDKAIKSTEVGGLFVLPCGPVPPNPAELLHTQAFAELLRTVAGKFDRIILDSPPLNAVADSAVLATQVDGVVVVVKAGQTNREQARRAVRALQDVQARIFGAVLNDIDPADRKYNTYYSAYRGGYGDTQDEAA